VPPRSAANAGATPFSPWTARTPRSRNERTGADRSHAGAGAGTHPPPGRRREGTPEEDGVRVDRRGVVRGGVRRGGGTHRWQGRRSDRGRGRRPAAAAVGVVHRAAPDVVGGHHGGRTHLWFPPGGSGHRAPD